MGRLSILLLLSNSILVSVVQCDTILQTESGPIRGTTVASGRVEAYLGIPYAEPPVGELRFAKPAPKVPWNDVLNAAHMPSACNQMSLESDVIDQGLDKMGEDCLYLNVWAPKSSTDDLRAVMFFIHGGAFIMGTSSFRVIDGSKLADDGDVVLVTINYRVGGMGFFAGHTEDAPGNQGLHDQILALEWVKDNARHFNGDPDNIVIFGESAGAFSVSLHQISSSSKNLFKRAILQSGSAINPLYTVGNKIAADINALYYQETGCVSEDAKEVIECMRNLSATAIAEADLAIFKKYNILLPHFGEELFPEGAVSLFQEGLFKDTEVLMGITRDEGVAGFFFLDPTMMMQNISEEDVFNRTTAYEAIHSVSFIRNLLEMTSPEEAERIVQSYLDDVSEESGYTYARAVIDAYGDSLITCGNFFQAEYQSLRGNPVYFYMFDHQTANSPFPKWMGVSHFEEVPYVFGNPMFGPFTEVEVELSKDVMNMWTSFAKTGNPNIPGGLQWPPFTSKDSKYYVIGKRDRVDTRPDKYRCERWRNVFLKSHK